MSLQEYECPACGGIMEFSPTKQKLLCAFCDTEIDVHDYVANHNARDDSTQVNQNSDLYLYKCGSCGGEILGTEVQASLKCPFCGNNVTAPEKFEGEFRPDYIIPFKLTQEDAEAKYKNYLKRKWLLPKVFSSQNHIDEIKGIYVPFWLYSATEQYLGRFECTKVRHWSDSGYEHTETSFYEVVRGGTEDFSRVPVDGSREIPDDLSESIEPYDPADLVPFNIGYLAGFLANHYDVDMNEDKIRAKKRMEYTIAQDFKKTITGYDKCTVLKQQFNTKNISVEHALYPMYILNTTWHGKNYLFAMNGQTGKFVGNLPVSIGKVICTHIGLTAIFTIIACLIQMMF